MVAYIEASPTPTLHPTYLIDPKVQKFTILPTDFSVSTDELTPTFKLKRSFVAEKYATAIGAMYKGGKDAYVPYV